MIQTNRILAIPNSTRGNLEETYITEYTSLLEDNDFIPIHSLRDGELITNRVTGYKNFLYHLTIPMVYVSLVRRINTFCGRLFNNSVNDWYKLVHTNITRRYIVNSGMLVYLQEEPFKVVPLIVMCVKRKDLFNISSINPDISKFCLLVDRKLILDEEHFKLYRNIKKYYLNLIETQIDIMYSQDITQLCYKGAEMSIPKFNTIVETLDYINSNNQIVSNSIKNT